MKQLELNETYTQYSVTRNDYGDTITTPSGTGVCYFRDISTLNRNVDAREEIDLQGQFWFAASDPHNVGDIIAIYGQMYRLEQVTIARDRLLTNTIQFYKATASLLRQIS